MAHLELIEVLSSPLLSTAELDDLAGITITFRANQNGGAHAPSCKSVSAKATGTLVMTIGEFREAGSHFGTCRRCGGGALSALSGGQVQRAEQLAELWESRVQAEREKAADQRRAEADKKRADDIDKRASGIVWGWEWDIERELMKAAGYPDGTKTVAATCPDCPAQATITFETRTLRVTFTCGRDAAHGYLPRDDGRDPLPVWRGELPVWGRDGRDYVANALVAPVLSGSDDVWQRVYGTRVADYQATVEALAEFDSANPEPMRLRPDIRCGECGTRMRANAATEFGRGEKVPANYGCPIRHRDGKYGRRDRADVDHAIDRRLFELLRDHPSWATAPELEPAPEALAGYADYLTAKIAVYDAHIGAAREDAELGRLRAGLDDELTLVTTVRERGALAESKLSWFRPLPWYDRDASAFTDLARALLTTRVEVTDTTTAVSTRIDEGTTLRRTLRVRELRDELADLEQRQREIIAELETLDSEE